MNQLLHIYDCTENTWSMVDNNIVLFGVTIPKKNKYYLEGARVDLYIASLFGQYSGTQLALKFSCRHIYMNMLGTYLCMAERIPDKFYLRSDGVLLCAKMRRGKMFLL